MTLNHQYRFNRVAFAARSMQMIERSGLCTESARPNVGFLPCILGDGLGQGAHP
jgi:hypothetical protein